MNKFEEWFVSQYFYTNMRFVHGDALFDKDGDFFRILAVQIAWEAWQSRQAEVDEKDKRIESALYVLKGLKAENDLWGCDQVEVQIEILEKALRGEHEA